MKQIIACILLVLAVVSRAGGEPQSARGLFNDACWDILNHPDRVEVCVWHPKVSADNIEPGFSLSAYEAGKFVALATEPADLVTWKIVSDDSYSWNLAVDGPRLWHARVRYSKNSHFLTADFNFGSGIVMFAQDGTPFADALMETGSDWVFQIFETYFPKDKVIRSVRSDKERRRQNRLDYEIAKAIEARKKAAAKSSTAKRP